MAVRQARPIRGAADFARYADLVQEIEHDKGRVRISFPFEPPDGFNLDSNQLRASSERFK